MSLECAVCYRRIAGKYYTTSRGEVLCVQHGHTPLCTFCGLLGNSSNDRCAECFDSRILSDHALAQAARPVIDWAIRLTGVHWLRDVPLRLAMPTSLPDSTYGLTTTLTSGVLIAHDVAIRPGLPEADTQESIAHELGHVLLTTNINKFEPIPHEVSVSHELSEGFCEVIRVLWIKQAARSDSSWRHERAMNNPDPVYGDGLRRVWGIFSQMQLSLMSTRTELFRLASQGLAYQQDKLASVSSNDSGGRCHPTPSPIERPTLSLVGTRRDSLDSSRKPQAPRDRPNISIRKNSQ